MNFKNVIIFLFLMLLLNVIARILALFIYPITYLFRSKILKYIKSNLDEDNNYHFYKIKLGVSRYKLYFSPLFWLFLFTTGINEEYCGPFWYKKEKKIKWFRKFKILNSDDVNSKYPIPENLIQKIRYFWLSYQWSALRNPAYALSDYIAREGQGPIESIKIKKCITPDKLDLAILPGVKFKDKDGVYRNNSGPYIRYTFDADEKWEVTNEGVKTLVFKTYRKKERFNYAKCKIYKCNIIKSFFILELIYGWNWWDGSTIFHQKFLFKKMDDFSIADYKKYQKYLKTQLL